MPLRDRLRGAWAALARRDVPAPPDWLHPGFQSSLVGGWYGQSWAGETVSAPRALTVPTVYACVSLIGQALATPPWKLVQDVDGGLVEEKRSDSARAIASLDFGDREGVVMDVYSYGNGFLRRHRSARGATGDLERLLASNMSIVADDAGRLSFTYMDPYSGKQVPFTTDDLVHIRCKALAHWPSIGVPPLVQGKNAIGLALSLQHYQGRALASGSALTGYLKTANKIDKQKAAELAERWRAMYGGAESAGKTPVLEQGLEYAALSLTSFRDMQMIEASGVTAVEICKCFGIPPVVAGEASAGGGSAYRALSEAFEMTVRTCLGPAAARVADQLGRQVLSDNDLASGFAVNIDLMPWLRGSGDALANVLQKLVGGPVLTPDEGRRILMMPPAPNGQGENLLAPMNMLPADQLGEPAPAPAVPPSNDNSATRELLALLERTRPIAVDIAAGQLESAGIIAKLEDGREIVIDVGDLRRALAVEPERAAETTGLSEAAE